MGQSSSLVVQDCVHQQYVILVGPHNTLKLMIKLDTSTGYRPLYLERNYFLGVFSNIVYVHPDLWGNDLI